MNKQFLEKLSNADALASNEEEVRQVLLTELADLPYTVSTDGLGSLIFSKENPESTFSVMLCGHMDEVGFMVRSISEEGLIYLMVVGGVKPLAQHLQKVRITTQSQEKIPAIINGEFQDGSTDGLYCDIGATTAEEVAQIGIAVGDMVTFATDFEKFSLPSIYGGKALDDRLACYVMGELMKELAQISLPYSIHFTFTSSEEVGIRGAKTVAEKVNPDVIFIIDVATYSDQAIRDHRNQRQIGKGPILTHFDRSLVPNHHLLTYVKDIAKKEQIPLQLDMFTSGGTDGGEAHKVHGGKPTVVTILPVRYGHCAYSLVNHQDVLQMNKLYQSLLTNLTTEKYKQLIKFF